MKKGIEVWPEYDKQGRWILKVQKKKGKLSLDEIREAARAIEWDFYLLVLDCFHDEDEEMLPDGTFGAPTGDMVTLYRTDLLYEEGER